MKGNLRKVLAGVLATIGIMSAAPATVQPTVQQNKDITNNLPGAPQMKDVRQRRREGAGQRVGNRYKAVHESQRQKRKHKRSNPNARNRYGLKVK